MPELKEAAPVDQIPPEAQIMQLAMGGFVCQAVYVAAKLGIADLVSDGPKNIDDLAAKSGAHEHSLYRLLRALASVGVFTETGNRTFANTPVSETLIGDSPTSMRPMILMVGDPEHGRVISDLEYSVRTGRTAWDHVHGVSVFKYFFEVNKPFGEIFNQAMTAGSHTQSKAILEAYDFSGIGTIADIAGGHGLLLGSILKKYPSMKGILFDLGFVLAGAGELLRSYGVEDRVELFEGDFFSEIPVVADAYIMKHIIHDWDDEKCRRMLGNIHRTMPDDGRVLIVDSVIPPGNDPHPGKLLDLEMLIAPGGLERTEAEFKTLLTDSGFEMTRIVPTASPLSVVEARKA